MLCIVIEWRFKEKSSQLDTTYVLDLLLLWWLFSISALKGYTSLYPFSIRISHHQLWWMVLWSKIGAYAPNGLNGLMFFFQNGLMSFSEFFLMSFHQLNWAIKRILKSKECFVIPRIAEGKRNWLYIFLYFSQT